MKHQKQIKPIHLQSITSSDLLAQLFCKQKKLSKYICMNQICHKYPYTCQQKTCSCHIQHQFCFRLQTSTIIKNFMNHIIPTQPLIEMVNQKIEKIINQLSDFREQIQLNIKRNLQLFGLTQDQNYILKSFSSENFTSITGSKIWKACAGKKQNKNKQFQDLNNKIKVFLQDIEKNSKQICTKINKQIQIYQPKQQQTNRNNIKSVNDLFKDSKIILHQQQKTLQQFFYPKKIQSIQLLYRASDNAFSTHKFHNACDKINDTLTLCITEFNNKIGGYTPIPWQKKYKGIVIDQKSESFVFSLTNKDKFQLTNKQRAVYHTTALDGPNFGQGSDLRICDKANVNAKSCSNINFTYVNKNYKLDDAVSLNRFIGGNLGKYYYKVKQWQVWKIIFEKEQQKEAMNKQKEQNKNEQQAENMCDGLFG